MLLTQRGKVPRAKSPKTESASPSENSRPSGMWSISELGSIWSLEWVVGSRTVWSLSFKSVCPVRGCVKRGRESLRCVAPTLISSFGVVRSGRVGFRDEKTRAGCVFLYVKDVEAELGSRGQN